MILGQEDPLEKKMVTHSGILASRIPVDRGAWWATVHGVAKPQTRLKQLSMQTCMQKMQRACLPNRIEKKRNQEMP